MAEKESIILVRQSRESYGDSFQSNLFNQYKLYVESAERISERRVSANSYLLTVNAFMVTLYGLLASGEDLRCWTIMVSLAGILVSLTWLRLICSYRDLNTVKFQVIHELEHFLPAALYAYEWHKAEEGKGKSYKPLSHLEIAIPIVFVVLYVLLSIWGVIQALS